MGNLISNVINSGTFGNHTDKENQQVRMLNLFALVSVAIIMGFACYNFILKRYLPFSIELLFAFALLVVPLLNHLRKNLPAKILFFFLINALVMIATMVIFPGRLLEYVYFLNSILLLIFFKRKVIIHLFFFIDIVLFYLPQILFKFYPDEVFSYTNPIVLFVTFYVVMNYFISENERYERHISKQNERLLRLNEEKNQLIGIAAHDLKSPMKRIEGLVSLIKLTSENLTEEQKKLIDHVSTVSREQNNLILDILDLDKIENHLENIPLETVDAIALLKEVIDNFSLSAGNKNIQLFTTFQQSATFIIAHENYLRQVFENLISNAIKFSPSHSKVSISSISTNQRLCISFIDQGPGISKEDSKKLFKKFQKLSAQPTGGEISTGLGLAITKKYVEAMNGEISCKSEVGKGAAFSISFHLVN